MQGCEGRKSRREIVRALTEAGIRAPRPPRPKWTEGQLASLSEMRSRGMSAEEIARSGLLPHSQNAIQKKLGRMGLSQRLKIVKFNAQQRQDMRDFLRRNWEGRTPQDLTDLWNEAQPRLRIKKNRVISYLSEMGLKIHYGEVQKINCARRKERELLESGANPQDIAESLRSSRAKLMRRRLELGRDIWTGIPLPAGALDE